MKEIDSQIKIIEGEIKEQDQLEEVFSLLRNYNEPDQVVPSEMFKDMQTAPLYILKTKIPTLDKITEGFKSGDLIVISAPTKEGKTTLAMTLTRNLPKQCLFFSYEIPNKELLLKYGQGNQFYLPLQMKSTSLQWIEERIVEAIAKYEIKMVFIDHLHYLFDLAQIRNPSLELGAIMRILKKIAIKYDIVIGVVAHTTKTKPEKDIDLSDIRDSSFISQEADFVIMLSRKRSKERNKIFDDEVKISVQANRRTGKTGSFIATIKNQFFEEIYYE